MSIISKRLRKNLGAFQSGFTLTELAMVLAIIALLFMFLMPTSTALLNTGKRELTRQRLKTIETALSNYVAVNRRLPCPADGTVAAGTAGAEGARTVATGDCTNNQVSGVVPYIALGLTEADINDGWDRRITYRAAYGLTRDNALDMSACDPAGTKLIPTPTDTSGTAPPGGRCWATCVGTDMTTCTSPQSYLVGKGFDIRDGAGTVIMSGATYTGAAYVVISHGENGYGSYDRSGSYQAGAAKGFAGTIEAFNVNGPAVIVTAVLPAFRDAEYSEGAVGTYFDDFLVRPSVFSIIQRAQLGPRSH
ncbi:MAG: type II secretion system protein [Rhodocyclales bacterium]|nr:type II secretion system protein [Rhodocyclales bacterium]